MFLVDDIIFTRTLSAVALIEELDHDSDLLAVCLRLGLTTGFVLRWDLIDWLIDAIEFLFIAGGAITGVVGLIKLMSGRGREATSV